MYILTSGKARREHEALHKETGSDRPAVRPADCAGTGREHRRTDRLALPLRLRAGDGGEDLPPAERTGGQLRVRPAGDRKLDVHRRHLRGAAADQDHPAEQHQRRARRRLAAVQGDLAGLHLLQGKAVLSGQLPQVRGRGQGPPAGGGGAPRGLPADLGGGREGW